MSLAPGIPNFGTPAYAQDVGPDDQNRHSNPCTDQARFYGRTRPRNLSGAQSSALNFWHPNKRP